VDLRARLRPDVKPSALQALLEDAVETPVRSEPHISLEEVDRDEVIVRIAATPLAETDGPRLADEVLAAIAAVTRDVEGGEDEPLEQPDDDDETGPIDEGPADDSGRRTQVTQGYQGFQG
jgi:hypothetical protein